MANIKLVGNSWEAEGIFDKTQNKTQKTINSEVVSKLSGIEAGAQVNRTYTATTGKPTANQTPSFGGTATVSQVTQDATGQISVTDRTIKIPNSTASTSAAGLMSAADKTALDTAVTNIGTMSEMGTTATTLAGGIGELNDDINAITPLSTTPTNGSTKGITSNAVYQALTRDSLGEKVFHEPSRYQQDLNNAPYGLTYYNPTTANSPISGYGSVFTFYTLTWKWQLIFDTVKNVYYRQNINDNGWTSWIRLNSIEYTNLDISQFVHYSDGRLQLKFGSGSASYIVTFNPSAKSFEYSHTTDGSTFTTDYTISSNISNGTISSDVLATNQYAYYLKKQGNVVNLSIDTYNNQFTINTGYQPTVFKIPAGYRPSKTIFVPCYYYVNAATATPVMAQLTSGGELGFFASASTSIAYIRLFATYIV